MPTTDLTESSKFNAILNHKPTNMKKNLFRLIVAVLCFGFAACNNDSETPESIAKEWCELNSKVAKATTDEEREKARTARNDYEKSIEEKYKGNDEMKKKVSEEVEKCEDASER
jgi:hypothetical protein